MAKAKTKAPELTLAEDHYLRSLVESRQPVAVLLYTKELYEGVVEFFDSTFIRLTRERGPNLFLYKRDIKYLWEVH
jgi:sRNA-binding regulator protein Hfq